MEARHGRPAEGQDRHRLRRRLLRPRLGQRQGRRRRLCARGRAGRLHRPRAQAAAEETAAIIASEGGKALALAADVTSQASVERCGRAAVARFGRIDILHNNVGVTHMGGPVELTEEQFKAALDLNLGPVYRTAKAVIPHMLAAAAARSSTSPRSPRSAGPAIPYFAYYATKAAVNQATVALAMQYARQGIRANCIMPGLIDTPLIYRQISGQYASVEEMVAARNAPVPMGKMGTAWDIAAAAVFLASDEAQFITGVCLPVDGGQSCAVGTWPDAPIRSPDPHHHSGQANRRGRARPARRKSVPARNPFRKWNACSIS